MLEMTLVRTGFYIYSQVIPFGSVFTGQPYQFPFIWETVMVTFVMIPAGVLLYRDDTGRTVAEKLARRARIFAARPALGHVRGDVRPDQSCLLRLRHRLRRHQVDPEPPPPWPARGRTRRPKSMTPRAFTRRTGSPARTR